MSSFDCAQHTFVEARLVQRSTAVNVPQRVAFGGEAITAPGDRMITQSARRTRASSRRGRDPDDFPNSSASHSCTRIEPTGDHETRRREMIALSDLAQTGSGARVERHLALSERAIEPPQPCDTMPRHGRSTAVRTGGFLLACYSLARASPASRTSILRSSVPVVTRSGKSSRSVSRPACMSMPSGSQPVQSQSALSAPSNRVA